MHLTGCCLSQLLLLQLPLLLLHLLHRRRAQLMLRVHRHSGWISVTWLRLLWLGGRRVASSPLRLRGRAVRSSTHALVVRLRHLGTVATSPLLLHLGMCRGVVMVVMHRRVAGVGLLVVVMVVLVVRLLMGLGLHGLRRGILRLLRLHVLLLMVVVMLMVVMVMGMVGLLLLLLLLRQNNLIPVLLLLRRKLALAIRIGGHEGRHTSSRSGHSCLHRHRRLRRLHPILPSSSTAGRSRLLNCH